MKAFPLLFIASLSIVLGAASEVRAVGAELAPALTPDLQPIVPLYCDSSKNTEISLISFPGHGVSVRGDFSASTGFYWDSKQNLPWALTNLDAGNGAPGSGSASIVFQISPQAMKKYGGFFNRNRSKFTFYFKTPGDPGKTVATCIVRVIVGSI